MTAHPERLDECGVGARSDLPEAIEHVLDNRAIRYALQCGNACPSFEQARANVMLDYYEAA